MGQLSVHICRCRAAVLLLAPLLLSGCIKGMFEGETNVLRPEIIKVKGHTDSPKPPLKEVCPVPEKPGPVAPQEISPKPCPPVEQKLLPQELSPQSPEQLMPIPPPVSPKPPEKPQSCTPQPPRLLAAAVTPDVAVSTTTLAEDVTWRGAVMISGVVTVAPQATLTIGPGTVVRFGGTGSVPGGGALLLVQGRLVASGTKEKPILFTSRFAEPRKGDWQGIVMLGSEKKNLLENCRLEGAETGLDVSFSSITLKNVQVTRCGTGMHLQGTVAEASSGGASGCDVGMALADSEVELHDPLISENGSGVVAERSSLYLTGGAFSGNGSTGVKATGCRVKIAACTFAGNGAGLTLAASQGSVAACRIAENADYGLTLAGSQVKVYGNEIGKNGKAGMRVEDGRGVAWGNSFVANGGYDLVNDGPEDFRAMGNWWGDVPSAEIGKRIYDRQADGGRGRVIYSPAMEKKPAAMP
ncbi:MAG TPA: right-handed parallel beta-helix repeat-containing protein [Geobacteraceae bacterium]|nr:right-handed parallel beta-helix repeat-containing protein [Geobacteraceae bacterium]